tara:strand:+ start:549 stop:782 length:234 start_codon:yes stop_codon:yes gene_type:complete
MALDLIKLYKALEVLKPNVQYAYSDDTEKDETEWTEAEFNKIRWTTGEDSNGMAIETTTCPHSEIDWAKFKTELDKL